MRKYKDDFEPYEDEIDDFVSKLATLRLFQNLPDKFTYEDFEKNFHRTFAFGEKITPKEVKTAFYMSIEFNFIEEVKHEDNLYTYIGIVMNPDVDSYN